MTKQHPIIPPQELVREWQREANHNEAMFPQVAALAAQWGADMELEACCEWLVSEVWFRYKHEAVQELRAARRPKPPSLKEQALERCNDYIDPDGIIRRALEALPDD